MLQALLNAPSHFFAQAFHVTPGQKTKSKHEQSSP